MAISVVRVEGLFATPKAIGLRPKGRGQGGPTEAAAITWRARGQGLYAGPED
jgi:hypothetical protein